MKIEDIHPAALKKVDEQELSNLHLRCHQWWSKFEGNTLERVGDLVREDVVNVHRLIVEEMKRRGMEHDSPIDGLPRRQMAGREGDLTVVKSMISIVGSIARGEKDADDIDVLTRAARVTQVRSGIRAALNAIEADELEEAKRELVDLLELLPGFDDFYLIQSENIDIPVRKRLDPEKKGYLRWHVLPNPQGPHDDAIEKYDLKLVPVGEQGLLSAIDVLLDFLDTGMDVV